MFKQKPARTHKRENSSLVSSFSQFVSSRNENRFKLGSNTKKRKPRAGFIKSFQNKTKNSPNNQNDRPKGRSSRGFSFPVPSVATLAVVAGTVLIGITALNWENFNISTPETHVFTPSSQNIASQTLQYAATGISPRILQSTLPEIAADNLVQDQAQGQAQNQTEGSAQGQIQGQVQNVAVPSVEIVENFHGEDGHLVTFEWQQYRVQRGDSVSSIANRFNVSIGAIIASNNITNARRLQEGTVLRIPNIDGIPHSVRAGENLSRIAASYNVPLEVILDVNDLQSDRIRVGDTIFIPGARMNDMDLRMSMGEVFIHPVPSRHVTSPFGMRRDPITGGLSFHTGVDLRANIGTPVVAAMEGVVSVVRESRVFGKHIIITHPNGFRTLYAHLNSFAVREGDRVAQGRKIGESGNTGLSTGPHLHFSIYDRNNRLVNPLDLLH